MQTKHKFQAKASKLLICGALLFTTFGITACDLAQNQLKPDREGSLEIQDYRDGLSPRISEDVSDEDVSAVNIPSLKPYIASGTNNLKSMPLVSLSVNQSVPLRDILFELAKQAKYDLELDPNIRGSIIFTARNRPFDQVVERIASISGLRYNFNDDVLRVEVDNPYGKVYKIDYLSYVRTTTGGIRNDVNVVSGEGADTGSNFEASSESEIDFWGELETNLEQILGGPTTGALKTRRDPSIQATAPNPEVETTDGQAVEANVTVGQVLTDEEEDISSADENPQTFTLNRQAGLINVYANEKTHKEVLGYLKTLKEAVTSQVLIEAKILEVSLEDRYDTGINWNQIDLGGEIDLSFSAPNAAATAGTGSPGFTLGYTGNDVSAVINALQRFGTVKALASPRLTVLNNQSAVMNVAENLVFFEVDLDVTTETEGAVTTRDVDIDADIRNVPEGVLMNVQPSINLRDQTISLALRPTITRKVADIPNPAIEFIAAESNLNISSDVPQLNVQEIDSIINVNSGQPIIMGGLLQDRVDIAEESVPLLGEIPLFGSAFRRQDDTVSKVELVIFLKATILENPSDSIHATDKDLYRKFSGDRRPLRF